MYVYLYLVMKPGRMMVAPEQQQTGSKCYQNLKISTNNDQTILIVIETISALSMCRRPLPQEKLCNIVFYLLLFSN